MYYILYSILYLISLLPFFVLYGISDVFAFLTYHVFGYRKKVVLENLKIAFPEKTAEERERIAKKFYSNLIDTFVETVKLLSISKKEIRKRALSNYEVVNALADKGLNIQMHSGHQMNWEFAEWEIAAKTNHPVLGVYMRLSNAAFERLMRKIRTLPNIVLIPAQEFKNRTHNAFNSQYNLALVADQNPGEPSKAYWLNFFGKPTPFVTGPEKGAKLHDPAIVFVKFVKIKRGYYKYECDVISETSSHFKTGELTLLFRDYLEKIIREAPDNYLWSHRRWKHTYKNEFRNKWIDKGEPIP